MSLIVNYRAQAHTPESDITIRLLDGVKPGTLPPDHITDLGILPRSVFIDLGGDDAVKQLFETAVQNYRSSGEVPELSGPHGELLQGIVANAPACGK